MLFMKLMSEGGVNTELAWLLWLVLGIFALIVVIGWLASGRKPAEVKEEAKSHHDDDLEIIEGIGPKVAKVLKEGGIHSFADLAHATPEKVNEMLKAAKLNMMDSAGWIEQAALAAKGDLEGMKKMQEEMKGGRRA